MAGLDDLGRFLRSRREALLPEDVGFAGGGRRRTPGLRREEIALLSALSADYYARLEQGRAGSVSLAALASLARAMRLSADERDYLFRLGGHQPPPRHSAHAHVDPAMLFLLDALGDTPAHVTDSLCTVIAQNRTATALFGRLAGLPGHESNVVWRWFTYPSSRRLNDPAEHGLIGRAYVADFRYGLARRSPGERYGHEIVEELLARSPEFSELWAAHEVAPLVSVRKRMLHPEAGPLDLQCDVVLSPETGHRLHLFRPAPGSGSGEQLAFLSVLAGQLFH
ncbi:MmyB family transcriptional regulator [Catenuloplanes japonicus]|uniref:MmyB family transcriptional regulator n=1 Tax=Catenuloplanes japonicus TaxID=33876 RepID=UPI000527A8E9|nr:helix-turn-helix domain-containing protein [Catenuloplanes japonicus]